MPIEICEIVIKAEVRAADARGASDNKSSEASSLNREELIQECVEQALRAIEEKKAR